jgi:hypothetical protein
MSGPGGLAPFRVLPYRRIIRHTRKRWQRQPGRQTTVWRTAGDLEASGGLHREPTAHWLQDARCRGSAFTPATLAANVLASMPIFVALVEQMGCRLILAAEHFDPFQPRGWPLRRSPCRCVGRRACHTDRRGAECQSKCRQKPRTRGPPTLPRRVSTFFACSLGRRS